MKNENRGKERKSKAADNKKKVDKYFEAFPDDTLKQCREVTGLSLPTIAKHKSSL